MARIKSDIKTAKIMDEASELQAMCKSNGWVIAKRMLMQEIMDLGDILSIDEKDPQRLVMEIGARQQAVLSLNNWISKIDNTIKSKNAYEETFKKNLEDSYVIYGEKKM